MNHCITFDDASGKMHVKFSPKLMMRYSGADGSTDSAEEDSCDDPQQPLEIADREKEIQELDKQHVARLHMQRTKNAMRWNILRRTMSLDLYWAECQKNSLFNVTDLTGHHQTGKDQNNPGQLRTRSVEASPERKNFVD